MESADLVKMSSRINGGKYELRGGHCLQGHKDVLYCAVDPKEEAADPEFDLENPHDCQQLIMLHFGSSASKDLPAVAQFYVNELRQKATKSAS